MHNQEVQKEIIIIGFGAARELNKITNVIHFDVRDIIIIGINKSALKKNLNSHLKIIFAK